VKIQGFWNTGEYLRAFLGSAVPRLHSLKLLNTKALWDFGECVLDGKTSHPRRHGTSSEPLWEIQISQNL